MKREYLADKHTTSLAWHTDCVLAVTAAGAAAGAKAGNGATGRVPSSSNAAVPQRPLADLAAQRQQHQQPAAAAAAPGGRFSLFTTMTNMNMAGVSAQQAPVCYLDRVTARQCHVT